MQTSNRVERGRRFLKIGVIWHVLGCGPLYIIIFLSKIGIGDPNPNPVGPGILAGLSFLPSLILMAIAVVMMRPRN